MARDLNIWIGTGRLGKEVSVKTTPNGKNVCSVSMASAFDDKVEWVNIVFWDKLADIVGKYCNKGSFIRVTGRLQTRSWEKEGVTKYITEIVASDVQFLGSKSDSQAKSKPEPEQSQQPSADEQKAYGAGDDDQIPF